MPALPLRHITDIPGVQGAAIIGAGLLPLSPIDREVFPEGSEAVLADIISGIEPETGGIRQINLTFQKGKIIARTFDGGFIVVRCESSLNVQMLSLSLAQTMRKVAASDNCGRLTSAETNQSTCAIPPDRISLQVEVMEKTAGTFWESMTESVAMTKAVALAVSNACGTGPFRKIRLRNPSDGKKKVFPVRLIHEPKGATLEGKVVLTLAVAEALGVRRGDTVIVETATGEGIFGWEGI